MPKVEFPEVVQLPDGWLSEVLDRARIRALASELADQIETDAELDAARDAIEHAKEAGHADV